MSQQRPDHSRASGIGQAPQSISNQKRIVAFFASVVVLDPGQLPHAERADVQVFAPVVILGLRVLVPGNVRLLPSPFHDLDLLRRQPVERVDPLVDLRLQRADVGRGVCGLGGEDICDKITNH